MRTTRNTLNVALVAAGLALAGSLLAASATTRTIIVGFGGGLTFSPTSTNIVQNDTVIWSWQGLDHTTTSDTGIWDSSPAANAPHSFTNSFPNVGTFPYHCVPHVSFGMVGTITVGAGSTPPTVTVTNPPDNTTLSEPASFTLAASASAAGSVTNVQFFQGTTSLGNDATSPYLVAVNNLLAGSYIFSAVASDNTGLKATNKITVSVVTPVSIVLTNEQWISGTSFQFTYSANVGLKYVVQRSANLFDWDSVFTNTAANNPETYTDGAATLNPGFYRVGRLPNP